MSKYSFEFKKNVVLAYLNGEGGYRYLSKTYDFPAQSNIEQWVHNYQTFGNEGLLRSRKNERTVRIINTLRRQFKLKDPLSYTAMPKATYMYWQKRFDRQNHDQKIEDKILGIRKEHKDYGYRRILEELRNQGYSINKKKVQRIVQKLGLQVASYTRKSRKYSSYK